MLNVTTTSWFSWVVHPAQLAGHCAVCVCLNGDTHRNQYVCEFVPNRTNVDMKDKWRTMKRQQRVSALAAKFGTLPAGCLDGSSDRPVCVLSRSRTD